MDIEFPWPFIVTHLAASTTRRNDPFAHFETLI
jgi:hypothetical protein